MDPQPANAFKLSLEADEVVIEFGNTVEPEQIGAAAGVAVTDRVTLPIEIGRRLLYWLNQSVERHAAGLRAEEAKNLPPGQAAVAARPGPSPVRAPPDQAGERGAELLRLVGGLGVTYQYERSFQIKDRALLANRFLLTLDTAAIPDDPCARTLDICDRMRIPQAAREAAAANFATAKCVHFGFEADAGSIICKLYLEQAVPPAAVTRTRSAREPVLLHLAFKWDLLQPASVTTRYWWHPGLSLAGIAERLAHVYRDAPRTSFEIARAALRLTEGRVAPEMLQYLEVEEAENARRSFDLNLYDAKLQVKDLQPLLHRMREHFGVRPGTMQALYDQIKTKALGHLAGGVHRGGEDFFNVYYGVVGVAGGTAGGQAKPQPASAARASAQGDARDQAAELRQMVSDLGAPYTYERSLRFSRQQLLTDRFLLTLNTRDIPGDAAERTLDVCGKLHMPLALRDAAAANFGIAKCVHFGFEAGSDSIVTKFYLEPDISLDDKSRASAGGKPALQYLAFKWDAGRAVAATARYWWFPDLSAAAIGDKLAQLYREPAPQSLEIARDTLALTRDRVATEELQYIEVEETDNPRRSFVLNLYRAKLAVQDLRALLDRMCSHFLIDPRQLQQIYEPIKAQPLGALAGGVHRDGRDFLTCYYRISGVPHFLGEFR